MFNKQVFARLIGPCITLSIYCFFTFGLKLIKNRTVINAFWVGALVLILTAFFNTVRGRPILLRAVSDGRSPRASYTPTRPSRSSRRLSSGATNSSSRHSLAQSCGPWAPRPPRLHVPCPFTWVIRSLRP